MPPMIDKDACDLLDADHIAVKHLFVEYARLATVAPAEGAGRQPIAMKICSELTVHAQIEEEIFYPALEKALNAKDFVAEARAEHQEAKALIARIEGGQPGPGLDELVAELARAIEHHVKEERDHLFTKARAAQKLDLVALGAQLKERQGELMGQAA